jgi:O-acetyl-ADP-ribose deacetylase (regulator of RNase III)
MADINPFDSTKTCFVVMPFGEKVDAAGHQVDFDDVHARFIKPIAESIGLHCERCDEVLQAGSIHRRMFERLLDADAVIVDLSFLNPNVFYELGVRHALARRTTVLIRREGTAVPFNLLGQEIVVYPADLARASAAADRIADLLRHGFASTHVDSPIHGLLKLQVERVPERLPTFERHAYAVAQAEVPTVGLVTGDLRSVRGIDAWVNSENTDMHMARPYDLSVSGVVRYHGAKRIAGRIVEDTVAQALTAATGGLPVPPGTVVPTTAGELTRSNDVRCLLHVAAAAGQVGRGYRPVEDIGSCVRNVLECIDSPELAGTDVRSVLFPLLGTGTARAEIDLHGRELLTAAIGYLRDRPASRVRAVWFMCLVRSQLDACQKLLSELLPGVEVRRVL